MPTWVKKYQFQYLWSCWRWVRHTHVGKIRPAPVAAVLIAVSADCYCHNHFVAGWFEWELQSGCGGRDSLRVRRRNKIIHHHWMQVKRSPTANLLWPIHVSQSPGPGSARRQPVQSGDWRRLRSVCGRLRHSHLAGANLCPKIWIQCGQQPGRQAGWRINPSENSFHV